MKGRPKTGVFTGTGAAVNVVIGFVPDYVRIINVTDGDETFEWFGTMADGTAIRTQLAVASQATQGVTALRSETLGAGFTVGAAISEAAKVYHYIAFSEGA